VIGWTAMQVTPAVVADPAGDVDPGDLAVTGSSIPVPLIVGAVLVLLLGIAALVIVRVRRRSVEK
jgi:LPXTG-motif cell wall-anchored protein